MTGVMLLAAIRATTLALARDRFLIDAIIVGAGAAGGLAAMLLTKAGLRVLVLEAGWSEGFHRGLLRRTTAALVRSVADPRWYHVMPPGAVNQGRRVLKLIGKVRQPVQSRCFAWELAPEAFVDDRDTPYEVRPGDRFDWYRVRQLGGRMKVPGHGRQYYRLAEGELLGGERSPCWPVTAQDLAPWYDLVEQELQLAGGDDSSQFLPDSRLAKTRAMSLSEVELRDAILARWPAATPVLGRHAPPLDGLEAAAETGRLSLRLGALVRSVDCDATGAATGVTWYDREAGAEVHAKAPLVFLCASALESTRILMTSRSAKAPDGIGAASDALGRYLMDHVLVSGEGVGAALPGGPVESQPGHCVYLPRFDLSEGAAAANGPTGSFGVQLYRSSIGAGRSLFSAVAFGEMAPRAENRVMLHPTRTDAWGMPVLQVACRHDDAEETLARRQAKAIRELAETAGVRLHRLNDAPAPPGAAMHECGTARMGTSPDNSVLDPNNQAWDAPGLYVTDAACFPSQGAQNPTLTIMALTARACAHATGQAWPDDAASGREARSRREFAE